SSVHPHVRGDNDPATTSPSRPSGSPPRAWGQHSGACGGDSSRRFTPTCVGTTVTSGSHGLRTPVHPHVRGDNGDVRIARAANAGSPPRAWGQLSLRVGELHALRFTPTCVGTT